MTELDVALTDYALVIECALFCTLALRWQATDRRLRALWVAFFASIGAGSLVGGTVHGFFQAEDSAGHDILWLAALLALGVASTAMWLIGARVQLRDPVATWVQRAAAATLIAYALVVLFVNSRFYVAILMYLPATVFLLAVMTLAWRRTRSSHLACGIAGLSLTFVAAAVQQLRVAIHPVYFNHNALFHVIQGISLFLLFVSARFLTTSTTASRSAR